MTPPDTNLREQERRHRTPLIILVLVSVFAVGLILFWVGELFVEPDAAETDQPATAEDIREGDVDVPDGNPVVDVDPEPDVAVPDE